MPLDEQSRSMYAAFDLLRGLLIGEQAIAQARRVRDHMDAMVDTVQLQRIRLAQADERVEAQRARADKADRACARIAMEKVNWTSKERQAREEWEWEKAAENDRQGYLARLAAYERAAAVLEWQCRDYLIGLSSICAGAFFLVAAASLFGVPA